MLPGIVSASLAAGTIRIASTPIATVKIALHAGVFKNKTKKYGIRSKWNDPLSSHRRCHLRRPRSVVSELHMFNLPIASQTFAKL
ncbi:hypothetical protein BKA70DRAFT_1431874 [Coprinopsis sp. MPI-PUGE-AT-0042]|nr:hypothetical protein BKA70DRAFT_1431874 [Coprinopsis sp. MPI-PUGE-AT-0042]